MKILFIYPNVNSQLGFNYGVAQMSAILKKAGHQVTLWQFCEDLAPLPTQGQFKKDIVTGEFDIIGFSVVTTQWEYTAKLAKWIKEVVNTPLICGGIHATVAGDEILDSKLFDFIMVGECDDAFLDFVETYKNNGDVKKLKNVGFKVNGKNLINPVRKMPILTSLPQKDYDIFEFQKMIDKKRGWVGLMASRGCPYSCTYCFNHLMVKKYRNDLNCSFKDLNYIRHCSVGQIIDEIKYLQKNFTNINMYIFDDDLFTFNKDFVKEFCVAYKKISKIPFVVNGHVGLFDEECAKYLADANCKIVKFGLESGSERIRQNVMKRFMSNDAIKEALSYVKKYNMHSSVFVMFGLPYEEEQDIWDTINLLGESQPGRYRWTYFFPFPGTESYKMTIDSGCIDAHKMKTLSNFTDCSCLDFGEKQNLLLRKVGKILPWFVNAKANIPQTDIYKEKIDNILTMNNTEWNEFSKTVIDEDKALSLSLQKDNSSHYAIKYNNFMGVISDYFMNEK